MPEANVAKLAEDLKSRGIYLVDGKYVVNEGAIIEDGVDQLEDFRTAAAAFNDTSNRSGAVLLTRRGVGA